MNSTHEESLKGFLLLLRAKRHLKLPPSSLSRSQGWRLGRFGANNLSDATGEARMISPDTAAWTLISYAQVTPHLPGDLLQNKAIIVSHGTRQFTSDETAVLNYTLDCYLPSADADGDGFPDEGTQPVVTIPTVDNARRAPIL